MVHMYLKFFALLLGLTATQATAQSCPDRYRFVDFGLEGRDGILRRGGTIFRAFDEQNTPLLNAEGTTCQDVKELSIDGRALKIPVVSRITVDLIAADLALTKLQLWSVEDATAAAAQSARAHQQKLDRADVIVTRGETFVCASLGDPGTLSCQVLSPYGQQFPLVINCDSEQCDIPAMAFNERLLVSAGWRQNARGADDLALEILEKIGVIQTFLSKRF